MRSGDERRVYVYFKYFDTFTRNTVKTESLLPVVTVHFNRITTRNQQPTVFLFQIQLKLPVL